MHLRGAEEEGYCPLLHETCLSVLAHAQGDNKGFLVCKKKMATSADLLCRCAPPLSPPAVLALGHCSTPEIWRHLPWAMLSPWVNVMLCIWVCMRSGVHDRSSHIS
jgi:hypothetical protein